MRNFLINQIIFILAKTTTRYWLRSVSGVVEKITAAPVNYKKTEPIRGVSGQAETFMGFLFYASSSNAI